MSKLTLATLVGRQVHPLGDVYVRVEPLTPPGHLVLSGVADRIADCPDKLRRGHGDGDGDGDVPTGQELSYKVWHTRRDSLGLAINKIQL